MSWLRAIAFGAVAINIAMHHSHAQETKAGVIAAGTGELHSVRNDGFMGLVIDRERGDFLVPTYELLAEQMVEAEQRVLEAGGLPDHNDLTAPGNFHPYPGVIDTPYRSRVVAILDSGVLTEHPMIADQLHDVVDFTGSGVEDTCGHGTIQAIRHALFEPRARLLILKVAGTACKPRIGTIATALEYLRSRSDVGYVYFAGGIDVVKRPGGQLVCDLADELVRDTHLTWGAFVATKGNVGSAAKWCPAEGEEVVGISVADVDTYARRDGVGGVGVLQKGEDTSFPDITAMTLSEFYAEYARTFIYGSTPDELSLMDAFAREALEYEESFEEGARLLAKVAFASGEWDKAVRILEEGLQRRHKSPLLTAELAAVYARTGQLDRAGSVFRRAFRLIEDESSGTTDRRFEPALVFEYGRYLAQSGETAGALTQLKLAAQMEATYIAPLLAYGGQQFYSDQFDDTIEINRIVLDLDPTFAPSWYNIAISHALAGRTEDALSALHKAESMYMKFDYGTEIPNVERIRELIIGGNPFQYQVGFPYFYDYHQGSPKGLERLSAMLSLPASAVRPALKELTDGGRRSLAVASVLWADRILGRTESDFHRRAAVLMISVVKVLDTQQVPALSARVMGRIAALYRRLKDHVRAQSWFEEQAEVLKSVSIRERERALLEAGLSALTIGDIVKAEELIKMLLLHPTRLQYTPSLVYTPRRWYLRSCLDVHFYLLFTASMRKPKN